MTVEKTCSDKNGNGGGGEHLELDHKISAEMCKEIYKENMGHYRFFGTLRARIAYVPATIVVAVVSAFAITNDEVKLSTLLIVMVFSLIYAINVIFQREQKICSEICRLSQKRWRDHVEGKACEIPSSSAFRKCAERELKWRGIFPDFSSVALFAFLAILGAFPALIIDSGIRGQGNALDQFAVPDALEPPDQKRTE